MVLELPPYRMPQVVPVIYRSIIDRTIFVLRRAIIMAAPAGALTWILANTYIGDFSIIVHVATWLQPLGQMIGMDGFILLAFILGLPANEIVIPILLMMYLSTGQMVDFTSLEELRQILINNGWTWLTAVNMMLFTLLHWPCTTTLLTVTRNRAARNGPPCHFLFQLSPHSWYALFSRRRFSFWVWFNEGSRQHTNLLYIGKVLISPVKQDCS